MMAWSLMVMLCTGASAPTDDAWHRTVGLLEYLEGDYAKALASGDEAELREQRGFADEIVKQLSQLESDPSFLAQAQQIQKDIVGGQKAGLVANQCHRLVEAIFAQAHLSRAPKNLPDLSDGHRVYQSVCASCHGVDGRAETDVAKALDPRPANFADANRIQSLTPYKVYNTASFGIVGTAMPGFANLTEAERWAVAFYVFSFLEMPNCEEKFSAPLFELASSNNDTLVQKYGRNALGCLRKSPRVPAPSMGVAVALIEQSRVQFAAGHPDAARQLVVDAYLNGVEPIEPALRAQNPTLVSQLENAFTEARLAAQNNTDFDAQAASLLHLLQTVQPPAETSDFWSIFTAAFFIVLREGFEAVVVLGALLAAMKKLNALAQLRTVHAGWMSALFSGALLFFFGQKALAGANREWLEAVVALVAVGLLLYAALWLNARTTISGSMGALRKKTTAAIGAGSTTSLFFIAYSSAGRESFETALFLQGLHSPFHFGAPYGALAGLGALLALILVIRSIGFRLPMKTMFKASTVLLLATAVMLLGKGLHGLQELDVLPLVPLRFPTISFLGVFPDWLTLAPQLFLAMGCVFGAKTLKHV
jgi:high-affinity iron transporter